MNSIGNEYRQIGGDFKVLHHTEYLETLVASGKLTPQPSQIPTAYHDPCYLGRHNGVYEAPRNLLHILSNDLRELPRNRENAFCCGAGGAQFWKEEEPGDERIADNRFREAQQTLPKPGTESTLAVGCPFCKSMLSSTPLKAESEHIVIKDIAEILLEGVLQAIGIPTPAPSTVPIETASVPSTQTLSKIPAPIPQEATQQLTAPLDHPLPTPPERKKWQPKSATPNLEATQTLSPPQTAEPPEALPPRKKWAPKKTHRPGRVDLESTAFHLLHHRKAHRRIEPSNLLIIFSSAGDGPP